MPNTSPVSSILPNFAAAKSGQPSIESKANNNFNQILKNEFANKVKKTAANTAKQATNNQPAQAAPAPKNTISNNSTNASTEKSNLETDKTDDDYESANAVSMDETSTLLNFVGDLNTFTLTSHLNSETSDTEASNSVLKETIDNSGANDLQALPPLEMMPASNPIPAKSASKTSDVDNSIDETGVKSTSVTQLSPATQSELDIPPASISTAKITSDGKVENAKIAMTSEHELSDSSAVGLTGDSLNQGINDVLKATYGQAQGIANAKRDQRLDSNNSLAQTSSVEALNSKMQTPVSDLARDGAQALSGKMAMPPSSDAAGTNKILSKNENTDKTSDVLSVDRRAGLNANERSANDQFSIDVRTQAQEARKETIEQNRKEQTEFKIVDVPKTAPLQASPPPLATSELNSISQASNFIGPRVGSKAWDQAVGQKIVWMVAGGEQSAQLTLNPPDLGPVQVVLSISDNQVDASFVSSHLDVREAIEAAGPKLREMMDNAGMSLSGFSVSSQSTQSDGGFSADGGSRNHSANQNQAPTLDTDNSGIPIPANTNKTSPLGLVDTFV